MICSRRGMYPIGTMTSTSSFKPAAACLPFLLFITFALPAEGVHLLLLMLYGVPLTRPLIVEDFHYIVNVFAERAGLFDQKDLDRKTDYQVKSRMWCLVLFPS